MRERKCFPYQDASVLVGQTIRIPLDIQSAATEGVCMRYIKVKPHMRSAHWVRLSNGIQSLILTDLAPRRLMVGVELHSSFATICPEPLDMIVSFFFGVLIVKISCPLGSRTDVFKAEEEGDDHWKTGCLGGIGAGWY